MTTSAGATTVGFWRAGVEVASAEVPGHLLEIDLPKSVTMCRPSSAVVQIVENGDPLLECCGRLTLPWVDKSGPHVSYLDVPPPAPFTDDDVGVMWDARNRLSSERRPPTSGDVAWSELRAVFQGKIDWESLELAVAAARGLITAWPSRAEPAVEWRPVDQPGGRLLVGITERNAVSHGCPAGSMRAPSLTARRTAVPHDRTLHALAAVSAVLAKTVGDVLESLPEVRDSLSGLFRRVAHRSNPSKPLADPPPSTWPFVFAQAYSAILRALAVLEATGPGAGHSPLAELWELYQAWTAYALRQAICVELGPTQEGSIAGSSIGRWHDGNGLIELHYQANIPAWPGSLTLLGQAYQAAIGALSPDLMLVWREGNECRVLVLDAKKRSAEMLADDLTVNASKYLWGVRRSEASDKVPAVEGAVMLAPLGGIRPNNRIGLADVYRAHPATGLGRAFVAGLLGILRGATATLRIDSWHADWSGVAKAVGYEGERTMPHIGNHGTLGL